MLYNAVIKRWAFNIFCLVSLLMFVGSATIWVRTFFAAEFIQHVSTWTEATRQPTLTRSAGYAFGWSHGIFGTGCNIGETRRDSPAKSYWHYDRLRADEEIGWCLDMPWTSNIQLGRFHAQYATHPLIDGYFSSMTLVLPLWLFLPAAVPPFLWWRKWRKRDTRGFPVAVSDRKEEITTESTETKPKMI